MMRKVLLVLALHGWALPVEGGKAPQKPAGAPAALPNDDLGISLASFDPRDIQILSARYTRPAGPVRDLKQWLAQKVAANGFLFFEVSDRLQSDFLSTDSASSQSLDAALGSASGAGVSMPSPLVTYSVAAELSEDHGTLTVHYLYRGQPRQAKVDYGNVLVLP